MPTIHLAFGPQWTLETAGPWSVSAEGAGPLVMERTASPYSQGAFARASYSAPVFNAPVRRLVRFRIDCVAPAAEARGMGGSAIARCEIWTDRVLVWTGLVGGPAGEMGYHEAEFNSPGGGHILVELRVEDTDGTAGPMRVEWSQLRLELLGFGEAPGPWPPQ
ncbi:MAG: hypothetical protein HPY44_19610 [Armatimonadetes bacterium]|nr:hypothetical protein [Armatimonadota bacterium]